MIAVNHSIRRYDNKFIQGFESALNKDNKTTVAVIETVHAVVRIYLSIKPMICYFSLLYPVMFVATRRHNSVGLVTEWLKRWTAKSNPVTDVDSIESETKTMINKGSDEIKIYTLVC